MRTNIHFFYWFCLQFNSLSFCSLYFWNAWIQLVYVHGFVLFLHRKAEAERVWIIQNIFSFAVNNRCGKERKERINNSSYFYILYSSLRTVASQERSGEEKKNALFGWLFHIWFVYGVVSVYGMIIQMCNVAILFFIHLYQSCHEQRKNIKYMYAILFFIYCYFHVLLCL